MQVHKKGCLVKTQHYEYEYGKFFSVKPRLLQDVFITERSCAIFSLDRDPVQPKYINKAYNSFLW